MARQDGQGPIPSDAVAGAITTELLMPAAGSRAGAAAQQERTKPGAKVVCGDKGRVAGLEAVAQVAYLQVLCTHAAGGVRGAQWAHKLAGGKGGKEPWAVGLRAPAAAASAHLCRLPW